MGAPFPTIEGARPVRKTIVNLIIWLVVGGLLGWIAGMIMKTGFLKVWLKWELLM